MSDDSDMSHSGPLAKLVDALCEGEISQTQLAQLEELLHSDAGARNFYIDHMRLVAELEWQQAAGEFPLLLTEDLPPIAEHILEEDEEDEAAEKRKAEELAKIESLAAEKFLAFRREQERHAEPTPAPRNAFFASVPWVPQPREMPFLPRFLGSPRQPSSESCFSLAEERSPTLWQKLSLSMGPSGVITAKPCRQRPVCKRAKCWIWKPGCWKSNSAMALG